MSGGFTYTYSDSPSDTIIDGASGSGVALIPDQVTTIANSVFFGNTAITQLVCDTNSSLQTIGTTCFQDCTNLTVVTLVPSFQSISIGASGFQGCTSLTSVTLDQSFQSIGTSCFKDCTSLTLVTFNTDNIGGFTPVSIGDSAFQGCSSLQQVRIPNKTNSLGIGAFSNTGLKRIVFGESLDTIGANCFENCTNLTLVDLGPSIGMGGFLSFGDYSFQYCSSLESIIIPDRTNYMGSGAFYNSGLKNVESKTDTIAINIQSFPATNITSVTISLTSTSICNNCFEGLFITSINIPFSVGSIGSSAFNTCGSLKEIIVPDSITRLYDYTFTSCSSLSSVTLPINLGEINLGVFGGCTSLRTVTIPDSVTSMASNAFFGSGLTSITFNTNIISLIAPDFPGQNITSVTISPTSTSISAYCFSGFSILPIISIPSTIITINEFAFQYCSAMTSITFPDSIISTGNGTCYGCTSLNTVIIYGSTTFRLGTVGNDNFYSAPVKNLTYNSDVYLDVPAQIGIDINALTSITLTGNITTILPNKFRGLSSIQSFSIPDSVINIGAYAFGDCLTLTSFSVAGGPTFDPDTFTGSGIITFLGMNPNLLNVYTIPIDIPIDLTQIITLDVIQNTTSILSDTFRFLTGLQKVIIANSVTSIGSTVFSGASGLTSLTFLGSPTFVSNTFTGNPINTLFFNPNILPLSSIPITPANILNIDVLQGSTSIADNSFINLNIISVTFPTSLTSIGNSSFQNNQNLTNITLPDNLNSLGTASFKDTPSVEGDVYIPVGVTQIPIEAFSGSGFTNLFIIDPDLVITYSLNDDTSGFLKAAKPVVNSRPVSVLAQALANNNKLKKCIQTKNGPKLGINDQTSYLKMDSSVSESYLKGGGGVGSYIDDEAFINCSSLTEIMLSSTVTYIGVSAFENCSTLSEITIPAAVSTIEVNAFKNCFAMTSVTLNCVGTFTDMKQNSFQNTRSINITSPCITTLLGKGYTNSQLVFAGFNMALVCFNENSKILCLVDGKEKEVFVQDLRKGFLVKTLLSGYIPVCMIGTSKIYNSRTNDRIVDKLYLCSQDKYPELNEDLIITGGHSILVDKFVGDQREQTMKMCDGRYFWTEDKLRLMACIDDRAIPYDKEGEYNIYHFALENEEYLYNYGVYANGLLVESCSKRYLTELSNMKLL